MILVIDDSATRSLALRQSLSRLGHGVCCHTRLQQALDKVNPAEVDLVVMALVRDEGNGFDGGMLLREHGFCPVLLVADVDNPTDDIWGKAQGLAGVVSWPLADATLKDMIDGLLQREQGGSQ